MPHSHSIVPRYPVSLPRSNQSDRRIGHRGKEKKGKLAKLPVTSHKATGEWYDTCLSWKSYPCISEYKMADILNKSCSLWALLCSLLLVPWCVLVIHWGGSSVGSVPACQSGLPIVPCGCPECFPILQIVTAQLSWTVLLYCI